MLAIIQGLRSVFPERRPCPEPVFVTLKRVQPIFEVGTLAGLHILARALKATCLGSWLRRIASNVIHSDGPSCNETRRVYGRDGAGRGVCLFRNNKRFMVRVHLIIWESSLGVYAFWVYDACKKVEIDSVTEVVSFFVCLSGPTAITRILLAPRNWC